ncbi:hypothetical protein [Phytohabitans houttuyneae]|uniref:hypothetical protein n=1 Tax=Phytohabitans houttuyneae TaxID=1076126 RepID=UPI001565AC95|nr:hypothetical protein [Phytohabitans houttuyneae]
MFREDLAGKVAEIRRRALDRYDAWLQDQSAPILADGTVGDSPMRLDEGRTEVVGPPGVSPEHLAIANTDLQGFLADLEQLERRFDRYDDLDPHELEVTQRRLSPYSETELAELTGGWGQDDTTPSTINIMGKIRYATNSVVLPMSDPEVDVPGVDREKVKAPVWAGSAARAFNREFLLPFHEYAARQGFCVVYLASVNQLLHEFTVAAQEDVLAIADACLSALDGEGISPATAAVAVSRVSLAINLAGIFMSPVPGAIATGTTIALDAWANSLDKAEPPDWRVEAGIWKYDAIYSAFNELNRLDDLLDQNDQNVADVIATDADIYFYSSAFALKAERPDPPDAIVDSKEAPANVGDDVFVADIETVYSYGKVVMPLAADEYLQASQLLGRCDLPPWVNAFMPNCRTEYALARSSLAAALDGTRLHLDHVSGQLVRICDEYTWVDEDNAAAFRAYKDDLRPEAQPPSFPRAVLH